MYQAMARPHAGAQYRTIDVSSKVEGASPHRLIAILYEELIAAMATAKLAIRRTQPAHLNEAGARAVAILGALESSLDFDQGGEVARALASVYREVTRLVNRGSRDRDVGAIEQGQKMVGEIAEAWGKISR